MRAQPGIVQLTALCRSCGGHDAVKGLVRALAGQQQRFQLLHLRIGVLRELLRLSCGSSQRPLVAAGWIAAAPPTLLHVSALKGLLRQVL